MLADAGLLDGKRATTHWAFADALQARCPAARIEPDHIFVADGAIWTSAGLTAAMDLVGVFSGSMRTVPVNHSAGPFMEG